ncbi:hypothetical protein CEV34_4391 [Brucella pseudogrignonensis]|uniref:Uncharacterized protein n=1 Tax=Brucella pseudogrignonensis TaxID=419475 RepID=A0A256G639_9HYPH|nr:hypothetical protein CEV34_4391 [Brucella pseudogrignonensis]
MMHHGIKWGGSTAALRNDNLSKPFDEYPATTNCHLTDEAPC